MHRGTLYKVAREKPSEKTPFDRDRTRVQEIPGEILGAKRVLEKLSPRLDEIRSARRCAGLSGSCAEIAELYESAASQGWGG